MNNKETKCISTVQPYLMIQTENYQQIMIGQYGISHFYEFHLEPGFEKELQAVPDGSVDLLFEIGSGKNSAYLGGTVLKVKQWPMEAGKRYFGVRFQPGKCLLPKDISIDNVVDHDVEIDGRCYGRYLLEQLAQGRDIWERAQIFMDNYRIGLSEVDWTDGLYRLENYIQNRIYETKGSIEIRELSKETGYSECYIRRVFGKIHGISPKVFEKFVRFQNVLKSMNEAEGRFDELALVCGYYDQSHMIKDFKTYCGVTPEAYMHTVGREVNEKRRERYGII